MLGGGIIGASGFGSCCKEFGTNESEIVFDTKFEELQKAGVVKLQISATGDAEVVTTDGGAGAAREIIDGRSPRRVATPVRTEVVPVRTERVPVKTQLENKTMVEWQNELQMRQVRQAALPTRDNSDLSSPEPVIQLVQMSPQSRSPRGEYAFGEARNFKVDENEMASLERLVSKLAGSPLGCIEFGLTFQTRLAANQIVIVRNHSLEGFTFGDLASRYHKVTVLGLKNSNGRVLWAPAAYIRIHGSDEILLIECTPFAMAMGLSQESSLANSSLTPKSMPMTPQSNMDTFRDTLSYRQATDRLDKPRRCCV